MFSRFKAAKNYGPHVKNSLVIVKEKQALFTLAIQSKFARITVICGRENCMRGCFSFGKR